MPQRHSWLQNKLRFCYKSMVCEIQNIESNFEEALDLSTSVSSKVKLMAV